MELSKEESLKAWQANAAFWDQTMGDTSNRFHLEVVRPRVNELLDVQPIDFILDIACGNGNYSAYLAAQGVNVVAFDYASEMIRLAKKRWARFEDKITFCIADATEEESLLALRRERPFTKAVSNMAIMDITDVEVLFRCVNRLLTPEGVFVFATQHPCFVTRTEKYMTPHAYRGEAIAGQPQEHCYYHRSMQDLFQVCFRNGFVIDGFYEECYGKKETPDVIILRAVKRK